MAKYALLFSYSSEAWQAMVASPSDRGAAAAQIGKALGGSLDAFYWMFGEYDGLAIFDAPDSVSAAALSVAVASTGSIADASTHELFSADDQAAMLAKAGQALGSYTPPSA